MRIIGNLLLPIFILLGLLGDASSVYAHGASIKYESKMTYLLKATYDDGTPMDNAQVLVYAPDNPSKVWGKGLTDEKGVYFLSPDLSKAGLWMIQIRKAGHGVSVNINIDKDNFVSGNTGLNKGQLTLMTISVLWGFVGTALYFSRRKES